MIHVATVHFQSDKWIPVQLAYLRKHIQSPFRVYAWLNDVPPVPADTFYYSCNEPVKPHAVKLNLLADLIYFDSNRDDDIIIFIDGDAFPVGDLEPFLREKLTTHKLVAVQRLENNGDIQPHPCFCATTVGFWRAIRGDWNEGFKWQNKSGQWETDVGGNLLKLLRENGVDWYPVLRSGGLTSRPVLFGIYGGLIYHHGAGFRNPVTRGDMAQATIKMRDKIKAVFPSRQWKTMRRRVAAENKVLSEEIFKAIKENPNYFEGRLGSGSSSNRNAA